nr:unnamed protein product [Callosobruchus chinensis]
MSEVTGISRTSIQRILKHYKWHPYKIQLLHELNEDDHDRRLQFCEIMFKAEVIDVSRDIEQLFVKIAFNNLTFVAGVVYRPPNVNYKYFIDEMRFSLLLSCCILLI